VEELLVSGRIEIGLFNRYGRGAVKGAEPLLRSEVFLIGAAGHPALEHAEVPVRTLAAVPLALPGQPNALTTRLMELAANAGSRIELALEAGSAALILDAVLNAGLCTVFPRHVAARELDGGVLRAARIVQPRLFQTTWMAQSTRRPVSAAARVVLRLIRELAATYVQGGVWAGAAVAQGAQAQQRKAEAS
jgi:LysR family nitrogen assimilation transcriptional regulator